MNKKVHETRFPRKPRLPKSSLLVFAYTNATTTSIHTNTNIAATHHIHPKTIDCFHDLHSFSFSYQLSRHIITLCNICQPFFDYLLLFTHTCPVTEFAVDSHLNTANSCFHYVFLRHFRFQKCLPVNSNDYLHTLLRFFMSFLTNADRTFTIKYRTDG